MFSIRTAHKHDQTALLEMMADFYSYFGYPFDAGKTTPALELVLENPLYGMVLLAEEHGEACGYAVVTRCVSLERGGIVALLDELYVAPVARGAGLGRQFLDAVAEFAQQNGARALLLEVEDDNPRARQLYERQGFTLLDRRVMVRMLVTE